MNDLLDAAKSSEESEERYREAKKEKAGTDQDMAEKRYAELKEEAKKEFIEKQKNREEEKQKEENEEQEEDSGDSFITH